MKKTLIGIAAVAAAFAAQATVYRAGLKGGYVNEWKSDNYHSRVIDAIGVFNGPVAGTNTSNGVTLTTYPPIWVNNRIWDYHGQMYFDGGTYYFGKNIDDATYIAVNGSQVLKDENWNKFVATSAITLSSGWYDVVFRMGNGTGGAGCSNGTNGKDGNPLGLGFLHYAPGAEAVTAPAATTDLYVIADPGDGTFLRCIEDTSYITLNSIAKTENGYSFNLTMTAPSAADVTVYVGESAGTAESTTGWTKNSGAVAFAAGETKTVEVVGTFATPPYFMVYLDGVGTTLAEGDGIRFWEWSDIKKCTMEPTVATAISSVTGTSASFAVTLGYDKIVEGMPPPAIMLKAYYGAVDAGETATGWGAAADFGSANDAGTASCLLDNLTEGSVYYVRFAAKTSDSDWVWSESLAFATSGPFFSAFPASLYENDSIARSFTISRPVGTDAEDLTVYLSYSANAATFLSGLPGSVFLAAGERSVTVPFSVVDNKTADDNAVVTIAIAENASYVRGDPSIAEITIIDDELITPTVCVWTGGAGNLKWESAANWEPRVPTSVDTAKFTSIGLSANAVVTVASEAFIKDLVIETTTAFTLAADENGGSLELGALTRADVEGDEGNHTIAVPLVVYAGSETNCVWDVAGANSLIINADISKTDGTYVLKTGAGNVNMSYSNTSFTGPWIIREGQITANVQGGNTFKGVVTIGGGDTPARLYQSQKNSIAGATIHVYTNGTFQCGDIDNGRADNIYVYEGGVAQIGSYFYTLNAYLHGGTYNGGATYNARNITSYASDRPSVFNAYWRFEGYQSYGVTVERGTAPVDLVFRNGLAEGGSGQTIRKYGDGIVKSTVNFNNLKNHFVINAGTWLVDNPSEYGLGIQETTVAAGAKIGGTGYVGMKDDKGVDMIALSNGSESNFATLSPGTIDVDTGAHVYGTFTAGRSGQTKNKLTLGNWSHLEIGVGPKNRETKLSDVDKLKVYGNLVIGENCTLDLSENSVALKDVAGGTYTIVEADKIEGTFANVIKPKNSWRVTYVSEEVGEETIVKSIVLKVPAKGLMISVR